MKKTANEIEVRDLTFCNGFCNMVPTSSSSSDDSSPPLKKKNEATRRITKPKQVYKSSFKAEWMNDYPITRANGNKHAFYCVPCKKTISCCHQGLAGVQRNVQSGSHISLARALHDNRKVSNMFAPANAESTLQEATTKAEVLHMNVIVQHNVPFLSSDHMTRLYPKMFPDSQSAKSFACGRTKTSCVLNDAMMPSLKDYLTSYMKDNLFSLVNDGSSDTGIQKMNAVCAHIFDVNRSNKMEIKLYDMCITSGEDCSKAETLFNAIDSAFVTDELSWKQCVSVGLDNTNVNMGNRNSVKSRVLQKNPCCFIAGCNCHLAHIAAKKGGSAYSKTSQFDIEDHMVDLYYYLKGST